MNLDATDNPDSVKKYNIQGIPTFMMFHQGNIIARTNGVPGRTYEELADPKKALKAWIDANIPIRFVNVDKLPKLGDFIEKDTGGLRVAKIIPKST